MFGMFKRVPSTGHEFYIRAKRLRGFLDRYPEIDASVPFKVRLVAKGVCIRWEVSDRPDVTVEPTITLLDGRRASDIAVEIITKGYNNIEYTLENPRSDFGYWYISEINYKYISGLLGELCYVDPVVTNFICANIHYEDKEKYGPYYRRSILVPIEEANKLRLDKDRITDKVKKNYVMVESKSNPKGYEYARLGQLSWRESKTITDPNFPVLDRKILAGPAETRKHMDEEGYIPRKERKSEPEVTKRVCVPFYELKNEAVKEADVPAEKYHALEHEVERLKALVVEQALEISELKRSKN